MKVYLGNTEYQLLFLIISTKIQKKISIDTIYLPNLEQKGTFFTSSLKFKPIKRGIVCKYTYKRSLKIYFNL